MWALLHGDCCGWLKLKHQASINSSVVSIVQNNDWKNFFSDNYFLKYLCKILELWVGCWTPLSLPYDIYRNGKCNICILHSMNYINTFKWQRDSLSNCLNIRWYLNRSLTTIMDSAPIILGPTGPGLQKNRKIGSLGKLCGPIWIAISNYTFFSKNLGWIPYPLHSLIV